jgi:hypothetical protein
MTDSPTTSNVAHTAAECSTWECDWRREMTNAEHNEAADAGWYPDSPSDLIVECRATATVDADGNGWTCSAGHGHRSDVEYYEAEEAAAARDAGHRFPANARLMDGSEIR